MTNDDSGIPKLNRPLSDATRFLRAAPVSEELVQRCRANALAIPTEVSLTGSPFRKWRTDWAAPTAVAALMVMAINLAQSVARMPSRERQIVAIEITADRQAQYLYSDRVIEPITKSINLKPRNES